MLRALQNLAQMSNINDSLENFDAKYSELTESIANYRLEVEAGNNFDKISSRLDAFALEIKGIDQKILMEQK